MPRNIGLEMFAALKAQLTAQLLYEAFPERSQRRTKLWPAPVEPWLYQSIYLICVSGLIPLLANVPGGRKVAGKQFPLHVNCQELSKQILHATHAHIQAGLSF